MLFRTRCNDLPQSTCKKLESCVICNQLLTFFPPASYYQWFLDHSIHGDAFNHSWFSITTLKYRSSPSYFFSSVRKFVPAPAYIKDPIANNNIAEIKEYTNSKTLDLASKNTNVGKKNSAICLIFPSLKYRSLGQLPCQISSLLLLLLMFDNCWLSSPSLSLLGLPSLTRAF